MRLIDANALMKKIREVDFVADVDLMKITHDSMLTGFFHGSVQGIVDRLPTAYNPDKIVEQLEKEKKAHEKLGFESSKLCTFERFEARPIVFDEKMCHEKTVEVFEQAVEIVKGGAV